MSKKNFQSIAAIIGILIITLSISYYFLIQLPKQESIRVLQVKREKCLELGKEKHQEEMSEGQDYIIPHYVYNKDLDTCLYRNYYIGEDGYTSAYVIDLYTNKQILLSDYRNGTFVLGVSKEEFEQKEKQLMEE